MLAIAITTAPRPVASFDRSLASLRAAGFDQGVWVFNDGPFQADIPACRIVNNSPPLGGLKNWARALETLVDETDAPWLMVLEDDIQWAKGAAAALRRDLEKLEAVGGAIGYLSLYLARKVAHEIEQRKGRRPLPSGMYVSGLGRGCWGSQAYVIPRAAAVDLLRWPAFDEKRRNYEKNRNRDNIVSGCLAGMGRRLYYRVPCLVDHAWGNANSSLGPKPIQRALLTDYWTGRP